MTKINSLILINPIFKYRIIFLSIFLIQIISCDNFDRSNKSAQLKKIDDENPFHVLHVCGKSDREDRPYLCFILKNENIINKKSCNREYINTYSENYYDKNETYNRCIIQKCYISIYPSIYRKSGYRIIKNQYPKFRVDMKILPDFSIIPEYEIPDYQPKISSTWSMERVFLSIAYNENREFIYYGATEDIEIFINNAEEILGGKLESVQREDLIILERMKKDDEKKFEMKIEESTNDLPHLRNILNGEILYATVLLSSGDVVEIQQPIQPLRDILLEERPCGTDNDFDLLDEITAEKR